MNTRWRSKPQQKGYALLALLLAMSLMVVAAAIAAPSITFEIQRSKEDEMIHRAMQYRRAIRQYVKQTGRYPMTLDDLNSGGVRCLRRRYKDPLTGRDFRMLHLADLAQVPTPGQNGSSQNGVNSSNAAGATFLSANNAASPTAPDGANAAGNNAGSQPLQPGASADQPASGANFGGGVVIGVASLSAQKSIREFDHKNHYNQWLFFYHPAFDQGHEIYGPTVQTLSQSPGLGAPISGAPNSLNGQQPTSLGGQPQTLSQPSQQ